MWLRIAILTLGTFAIGTDGFVVAGVLGDISGQLDVGIAKAGQLVTLFAWVYALSSPVIASITGRIARRRLLLTAIAAFVAANVVAALATELSDACRRTHHCRPGSSSLHTQRYSRGDGPR